MNGLERAKTQLKGARVVVVGLGQTGLSCARFLAGRGAKVTLADDSSIDKLDKAKALIEACPDIDIKAGGAESVDLTGVSLVVVSPGVPYAHPLLSEARRRGAEVISDIELAWRFIDAPVLAVAGTNGKTTTTTLLGKTLKDAGYKVFVGGNIGTPAIECVENGEGYDLCVLEISSFHLETTLAFNPHIAALLNITEDHLDRYDSFEHYANTKFRLFENQTPKDFSVVNINDPVIAKRAADGLGRGLVVPFTVSGEVDKGLFLRPGEIVYRPSNAREEIYPTSRFKLTGLHNMENIMAVIAMARLAGASQEGVLESISGFKGLAHRMEFVRTVGNVTYIDDSKGTNIGALETALRGMNSQVVLIMGGRDKGGDYGALAMLVRDKVRAMVLIGEARFKIQDALGGLTDALMASTLDEAVAMARSKAIAGDTVLLSPACSSFDMFKSYKERGDLFKEIVGKLK
ncbi:MAG: UDP-N-acetylmuramoyl-L-alanine--D-glutamate ligase [Deltaproteobacteria bacterium]|nr:UDP-N-acetylmuramoyl-L-alanine--D-glutamate ligase [Deltaproteobacteria bacterium]